ncbi:hypothetical protein BDV25DRAFT_150272 [Aspergillus avenaceus]|uniref:Uncharacterized protein n=1 Tax=Aspergillus avenaceus TaxID=36643 RepID=A0A5N6U345_ASPAV|nr:hypothetical protein BDV25DRAFT_150272 [Aspergillus avenaceus]
MTISTVIQRRSEYSVSERKSKRRQPILFAQGPIDEGVKRRNWRLDKPEGGRFESASSQQREVKQLQSRETETRAGSYFYPWQIVWKIV